MIYKTFYYLMIISYLILSIQGNNLRMKLIGVVLTIANGLIFWR